MNIAKRCVGVGVKSDSPAYPERTRPEGRRREEGGKYYFNLPRMVSRMLMRKSAPQPRSRKTPTGGRMTARMILQISLLISS